mmetsp:Transcript_2220/g.5945  ORF Transcript_2220/g.5945 Transcript_2220/m.5945 type:complete len:258 (+) Transcript_2220:533-1306(+)
MITIPHCRCRCCRFRCRFCRRFCRCRCRCMVAVCPVEPRITVQYGNEPRGQRVEDRFDQEGRPVVLVAPVRHESGNVETRRDADRVDPALDQLRYDGAVEFFNALTCPSNACHQVPRQTHPIGWRRRRAPETVLLRGVVPKGTRSVDNNDGQRFDLVGRSRCSDSATATVGCSRFLLARARAPARAPAQKRIVDGRPYRSGKPFERFGVQCLELGFFRDGRSSYFHEQDVVRQHGLRHGCGALVPYSTSSEAIGTTV